MIPNSFSFGLLRLLSVPEIETRWSTSFGQEHMLVEIVNTHTLNCPFELGKAGGMYTNLS